MRVPSRGDERLDEQSASGEGFLPEVCREWEAATEPAEKAGIRVVRLRIGVVLSARGGALQRMLTPFRLGLGGPIGRGRRFMSWIALDDLVGAIHFCLFREDLSGVINGVAPKPVRNAEFARTLARTLGRPAVLPVPAAALRIALGEMGRELLLAGARILPGRLLEAGFKFRHPDLSGALGFELEMEFAPLLVLFRYDDVPGVIGKVGNLFGAHQVNIAHMSVGRSTDTPGGDALGILSLDSQPPAEALTELSAFGEIERAWIVKLPQAGYLPTWMGG